MRRYLSNMKLYKEQGLCNKIYISRDENRSYIVKKILNYSLDRSIEIEIQKRASKLKIAPNIIDFDKNYIVSQYIDAKHLTKLTKRELREIAKVLRRFHKINKRVERIDLKKLLFYKDFILIAKVNRLRRDNSLIHADLNHKNILFAKRVFLIDFEYSMLGDIYFDLASICVEFSLNGLDERYFLKRYFSNQTIKWKKLKIYKQIYKEAIKKWFKDHR